MSRQSRRGPHLRPAATDNGKMAALANSAATPRGSRRPLNKVERQELAKGRGSRAKPARPYWPQALRPGTRKPLLLSGLFTLRLLNRPCQQCMSCPQRSSSCLMWLLRHFAVPCCSSGLRVQIFRRGLAAVLSLLAQDHASPAAACASAGAGLVAGLVTFQASGRRGVRGPMPPHG